MRDGEVLGHVQHHLPAGPGPLLADLLGLPVGPLRGVGGFLLVFAAAVAFIGTRSPIPRRAA